MLARTADNLFWLSRYVERAESLARILDVALRLATLPSAYAGTSNEWESAIDTAACREAFYAAYPVANEKNVTAFIIAGRPTPPPSAAASRSRVTTRAPCARPSPPRCGRSSTMRGTICRR